MKTMTTTKRVTLTLIITIFSFSLIAKNYETKQDGKWNTSSTWLSNSKPGTSISSKDTVFIKHAVELDKDLTIYGVFIIQSGKSLSGNKNITVKSSGELLVYAELEIKNLYIYGTFTNSGTTNASYNLNTYSGSSIYSSGNISVERDLSNSGTFENSGNISIGDQLYNYGSYTCSGTISVSNDLINDYSASDFTNTGSINISDDFTNEGQFLNQGTINVSEDMTIDWSSGFTNEGNLNITDNFTNNTSLINSATGTINSFGNFINNWSCSITNRGTIFAFSDLLNRGTIINYDTISIKESFTNDWSTTFTNNGTFILRSDSTLSASVLDNGTMNGSGNTVVELFLKGAQWHYVAIPVTSSSSNVFWGAAIYSYNEEYDRWDAHFANESLDVNKGYDVYFKNNTTIKFVGTLRNGTQSMNASKKGSGYHLVPNPYLSTTDWNHSWGWTKTNIYNGVYIWDPTIQNIASYVNGASVNNGSNKIPPMQAFFVKSSSSSGQLVSTNSVRKIDKTLNLRESTTSDEMLKIQIISENGFKDETLIRFNNQATKNFDGDFDANKMLSLNISVPQIYTKSDDLEDLSINSIPEIKDIISIPLYLNARVSGRNKIMLDVSNINSLYNVSLEDLKTGKMHDLIVEPYSFNSNVEDVENRFIIHFSKPGSVSQNPDTFTIGISETERQTFKIYSLKNSIIVESKGSIPENCRISVYLMNGAEILNVPLTSSIQKIELNSAKGYYTVKVSNGTDFSVQKVFIK